MQIIPPTQLPSLRYTLITLLNVPTLSIWGADQKDRNSTDFAHPIHSKGTGYHP